MYDAGAVVALDSAISYDDQKSSENLLGKTKTKSYVPKRFAPHPFLLNDRQFNDMYGDFVKGVIDAELLYKTVDVNEIPNLHIKPFDFDSKQDYFADDERQKILNLKFSLSQADSIVSNIVRTCEGKSCSYFENMYALTKHFKLEELSTLKRRLHYLIDEGNSDNKVLEGIVNMSAFDNVEKYKSLPRKEVACAFYRDLLPNIFNRLDYLSQQNSQKSA